MVDPTPPERAGWIGRGLGIAALALATCALLLPMVTIPMSTPADEYDEAQAASLRLNPFGPVATSSDLSANLRSEPFDMRGLRVTASWFSPVVGEGLDYMQRNEGPNLESELGTVRFGMVLLILGLVAGGVTVVCWAFRGGRGEVGKVAAWGMFAMGVLVLTGWAVEMGGLLDMADETRNGIEGESEGYVDADVVPGSALFLLPFAAIVGMASGIMTLRGPRASRVPGPERPAPSPATV